MDASARQLNDAPVTFLGRLALTPLRDVVRGRLTGRLSLHLMLARWGLPEPLADFARRTVIPLRASRLCRVRLACELAAVFSEAMRGGWTVERILAHASEAVSDGRLISTDLIPTLMLPAGLRELVRRVIARTRLWPSERVDVARELSAHFRDGLSAGVEVTSLERAFGDPDKSARLIRRAKKRKRPLAWRGMVRATQAVGALLLLFSVTYACLAARFFFFMDRPSISRNFTAEYNARFSTVREQDRAWPTYRRAYLAITDWPTDIPHSTLDPNAHSSDLTAWAERNQQAVRLFRLAARRPLLGMVLSDAIDDDLATKMQALGDGDNRHRPKVPTNNPSALHIVLPHLGVIRKGTRLLEADSRSALREGDADRLYEDIAAIIRMAVHTAEPPMLIAHLVAISGMQCVTDVIENALNDNPALLTDEQIVRISHALSGVRGGGAWQFDLSGERFFFEDLIQRCYSDNGDGNGRLAIDVRKLIDELWADNPPRQTTFDWISRRPAIMPVLSALTVGRRQVMRLYDDLMSRNEQQLSVPLWHLSDSSVDRDLDLIRHDRIESLRFLPISVLVPSLSRAGYLAQVGVQDRDAALVAMALELFRRQRGEYPTSLQELIPQYLPLVPPDRYDGKQMKYRLLDGRPLLYSVGVDRDDDGGRLPDAPDAWNANVRAREWLAPPELRKRASDDAERPAVPDGDWILWPAVSRLVAHE